MQSSVWNDTDIPLAFLITYGQGDELPEFDD